VTPPAGRFPQRGEIWWTRFPTDPPDKGRRPVIVVSPNGRNNHPRAATVLAIPLSTSVQKLGPAHLLLRAGENGTPADSSAAGRQHLRPAPRPSGRARRRPPPADKLAICRLAALVRLAMGCVE